MTPPLRRTRTFRKTLVGLVILPSLVLLTVVLAAAALLIQETGKFSQRLNTKIAQGLGAQVKDHLDEVEHNLDDWATFIEGLSPQEQKAAFLRLAAVSSVFESVYLLDPGKIVSAEWPAQGNQVGNDFSGMDVLASVNRTAEVAWSDSLVSPRTGRPIVSIAKSFRGGILLGSLDLEPLARLVARLAEGAEGEVSLVDPHGTYLAHPDPEVTIQRQTNQAYLAHVGKQGFLASNYVDRSDDSWSLVSVQPLSTLGWAVLVTQPLASVYQPLTPLVWFSLPLLAVLGLGGVGLVRLVNRRLLVALEALRDQTEGLGEGDFEKTNSPTGYLEFDRILESFLGMRQSIWQREQETRLGQERYRRMFDDAAVGIYHAHPSGQLIDLNQTLAALLGYEVPSQAIEARAGTCQNLFVGPEEWAALVRMLQDSGEPKLRVTTEVYHRNGGRLIIHLHLARVFDPLAGEFILEGFVEDITELKRAETAVNRLNKELEAKVLERTHHLAKALEDLEMAQSHLVHSEKMAALGQLIAGIAHELNTPLAAIHASNENISSLLRSLLEELPPLLNQLPAELLPLQQAMYEAADREISVVSSAVIRQRRRRAAEVLATKGKIDDEMVDCLAELGPLVDLERWLSLLTSPWGASAVQMTYNMVCLEKSCFVIGSASEKAAKVISALRTFTHQAQKSSFEKVNLKVSIETVLTLFQNRFKTSVVVKTLLESEAQVWGLADKLNQVWTNLVANALQAMDDKGTLEITTTIRGGTVRVSIVDSGPGIDEEYRSRVFEPFFTTKKAGEGTGLGLDISKKIVEEHHGRISFESRPGRTEFYVELPEAR